MTWVCAACSLLAAGCAGLPGFESREPAPWVKAGGPQPASDVESLVMYFEHISRLPASEFGREHDTVRQAYNRARSDFNRVRFAMVLAQPNTAFTDNGRAIDVLEPVAKNANGRLRGLAVMLTSHVQEQKRLNASVEGLQQKLDALRSLERNMIERAR